MIINVESGLHLSQLKIDDDNNWLAGYVRVSACLRKMSTISVVIQKPDKHLCRAYNLVGVLPHH